MKNITRYEYEYDIKKAIAYAHKYYKNYNSEYPTWHELGGDCANFISQCLFAGNIPMVGTPGIDDPKNFDHWFSKGNKADINLVSSTWRGAGAFSLYWQNFSREYKIFEEYTNEAYNYANVGDFISLLNSSTHSSYHTMIIVEKGVTDNTSDLICAQHSPNLINASLLKKGKGFIIYKL